MSGYTNACTQNRFGPPPLFTGASPYPTLDHPVSGRIHVTTWHFNTIHLIACVKIGFPSHTSLTELCLPHRYTPWHVIQNGRCTTEAAHLSITKRFHALLTLREEFFSAFPRGTSTLSDLNLYLGLAVNSAIFMHPIRDTLLY